MKTPMQDLIDEMQKSPLMFASALTLIEEMGMLEKEKDVMCDFVEYCDEANRNYQETEESWCEDLTIDDMFDKRFNTK